MTLMIEPYEAVGPLRFGMGQEEVVQALGIPQRITKNRGGESILWFEDINAIMEGNYLAEVGIGPKASISICGVNPFDDYRSLEKLCEIDGDPREILGSIVLKRIGISIGGFRDNDESQKAITVFCRGRWDILESHMKSLNCK